MTYVITDLCRTCQDGACASVCPVDCIHQGADQYHIDPDECIDCGACVLVCPVDAIFYEFDVDPERAPELPDFRKLRTK